jgi:antitoxin HicB
MEVLRTRLIDHVPFLIHIVGARESPLSVVFYRLDSGKEPVRDWLRSLDRSGSQATEQTAEPNMKTRNIGSNFDDFLIDEGLSEEVMAVAAKRVIAYQLADFMRSQALTKTEMARRMGTSRAALERLLDPDNTSVTLQTLQSAARAVGGRLEIRISERRPGT